MEGLEAVRGVAALVVVVGHAGLLSHGFDRGTYLVTAPYLAVDLFFLLSGYVLSRRFQDAAPRAGNFLVSRVRRLWPPIAAGVTLGAIFFASRYMPTGIFLANLLTGLALVPLGGMVMFNGPAWSVHFELWANLLHALLLGRLSNPALLATVIACAGVLVHNSGGQGLENFGQGEWYWFGIPRVIMSYGLGMLVWRWIGQRTFVSSHVGWAALGCFVALLAWTPSWLRGPNEIWFALVINPIVLVACFAITTSRLAVWLGAFSFPVYAIHYPVLLATAVQGIDWRIGLLLAFILPAAIGCLIDIRWRSLVFGAAIALRRRRTAIALEPA